MSRNWMFTLAVALTLIIAAPSRGIANPHHCRHGGHEMGAGPLGLKGFLDLKLTESQQAGLTKIIDKYHGEKKGMKARLWEAGEKLSGVLHADTVDEEGIRKAFREVSSIREEMAVLKAKMFAEIKTVLTPGQVKQLEDMSPWKAGCLHCERHHGHHGR